MKKQLIIFIFILAMLIVTVEDVAGSSIRLHASVTTAPSPSQIGHFSGVNFQYWSSAVKSKLFNERQFQLMAQWGINYVRFGFKPSSFNPSDFDKAIQWSIKNGMAISLRYRAESQRRPNLPSTKQTVEAEWLNIWKTLAERYKGQYPNHLFFSLYCEPHDADTESWRSSFQKGVDAIHAIDPHRICIVDSLMGSGGGWGTLKAAIQKPLSGKNIWYSTHIYRRVTEKMSQNWGGYGDSKEEIRRWLREYCRLYDALDRGYTIIIEETGIRNAADKVWWRNFLSVLREEGVHYAAWAWDPPNWTEWTLIKDLNGNPSWQGQELIL